jgi:hypothetical protein
VATGLLLRGPDLLQVHRRRLAHGAEALEVVQEDPLEELQQVSADAEHGRRTVDKLVRVQLLEGREAWVLVHVEVQSQRDPSFAERMVIYNYWIYDRHRRQVVSLALLADDSARWKPPSFGHALWGCEVTRRP